MIFSEKCESCGLYVCLIYDVNDAMFKFIVASVKILSSSLQRSHIFRLKMISLTKRKMFSVFKVLYPTSSNNEVTH